ncbi:uncharacterized protein Tco025E_05313 [Trypanosoma conorhini]|uniref:Uncharacterized protein n=1 Tax=Trypanosoma conorhini TaxID=83891 RepID=A0A3R7NB99_9TRYP|nr:uncharacterized protein Tco025E_05313 [Trypanosoma conorhini]RNF16006.1 hypothetical protein Tco025E_05313 [Trypanosoma conorhini]
MGFLKSVLPPGTSLLPLLLIVLYVVALCFSWANYGAYFRLHLDLYGKGFVAAYLAFCIIGTLVYALVSSVLWLRGAVYASRSSREAQYIITGVSALFFSKDLPLFVLESTALTRHGWRDGFQGFCFIVQLCFFLLPFIVTWLTGVWFATSFVERQWGDGAVRARVTLDEALAQPAPSPPPPLMLRETPQGPGKGLSFLAQASDPRQASSASEHGLSGESQEYRRGPGGLI